MRKALVFSLPAAHRFMAGVGLPKEWHKTLTVGVAGDSVVTIQHHDAAYVFRSDEKSVAQSIVIQVESGQLFDCFDQDDAKLEALKRAVQAGILVFENGGQIPEYWRPYSKGQYISFQGQSFAKMDRRRLVLWRRTAENPCAFIFATTLSQRDFENLKPDMDFLARVMAGRTAALAELTHVRTSVVGVGTTTLNLDSLPEQVDTVVQGWKLSYLLKSILTKRQLEFVEADLDRPIRLKGAAGTGKTLAMVAKLLREAKRRREEEGEYRFLFLTHNTSAADLATDYALALDEDGSLFSGSENQAIKIDTLLSLAIKDLAEDLGELSPISTDAHEGKKYQLIIISDVVKDLRNGAWITLKKGVSSPIQRGMEAEPGSLEHDEFCWDIMNEIAGVLDAEGVRDNRSKRDAYIKERRRPGYLMPLEREQDRELLLAIYDQYRASLKRENLISVDQLIADYLGYLDSFRWDARRKRLGYDAIFVDEFHLFNRVERATFPALMRVAEERPIILMALDPRQSPRAFFIESAFGLGEKAIPVASGQAKLLRDFEFNDVFRYTPQIANLLSFVNNHFPENDLSEEWLPGVAHSAIAAGSIPEAKERPDLTSVYSEAVSIAQRLKRATGKGEVAILTLSHKSFDIISRAGKFERDLYVVDSRESLNKLQYVGSKIVFSMPEYVAGVQFDHVIVADANASDDVGRPTAMGRSRFGSALYLAASRARKTVHILANSQAGGFAPVIRGAIVNRLVEVAAT